MSLLVDRTSTYMLAASIPSLKNQPLCNFLAEMDRNENLKLEEEREGFDQKVVQEDVRLQAVDEKLESAYSWKNILRDSGGFGLTVGLTSAVPVFISEKINCKSIEQGLRRSAVVGVCTTVVELIWYGRTKYVIFRNSDSLKVGYALEIINNRSSRLQEKIDGITQRLGQQQGEDDIQLSAAKDYFDQKRKELTPEQKA